MKAGLSQSTQLKQELKINPRLYQAMDLLYSRSWTFSNTSSRSC